MNYMRFEDVNNTLIRSCCLCNAFCRLDFPVIISYRYDVFILILNLIYFTPINNKIEKFCTILTDFLTVAIGIIYSIKTNIYNRKTYKCVVVSHLNLLNLLNLFFIFNKWDNLIIIYFKQLNYEIKLTIIYI